MAGDPDLNRRMRPQPGAAGPSHLGTWETAPPSRLIPSDADVLEAGLQDCPKRSRRATGAPAQRKTTTSVSEPYRLAKSPQGFPVLGCPMFCYRSLLTRPDNGRVEIEHRSREAPSSSLLAGAGASALPGEDLQRRKPKTGEASGLRQAPSSPPVRSPDKLSGRKNPDP